MIDRIQRLAHEGVNFVVAFRVAARRKLPAAHPVESGLTGELANDAEAFALHESIGFRRQKIVANPDGLERIRGTQPHGAATLGTQMTGAERERFLRGRPDQRKPFARGHRHRPEEHLYVGQFEILPALEEPGQRRRRHRDTARSEQARAKGMQRKAVHSQIAMETGGRRVFVLHSDGRMILQIAADLAAVAGDLHAHLREVAAGADAGQHQHLRRVNRAACQHDLAQRPNAMRLPVAAVLHADRASLLEQEPGDVGANFQFEIGALHRRVKIGDGSALPPSAVNVDLKPGEALLHGAVVVGRFRISGRPDRVEKRVDDRIRNVRGSNLPGSVRAVIGVVLVFERFRPLEIRKHVVVRPTRQPHLPPAVEIAAVSTNVGHHVYGGAAAENFAARMENPAPAKRRLRLRHVGPIEARIVPHLPDAERHVDHHAGIPTAGLQHENATGAVFGQPVGQNATGSPGSDDHEIAGADLSSSQSSRPRGPRPAPSPGTSGASIRSLTLRRTAGRENPFGILCKYAGDCHRLPESASARVTGEDHSEHILAVSDRDVLKRSFSASHGFRRQRRKIFQGRLRKRPGVERDVALERFPQHRFFLRECRRRAAERLPRDSGSAPRKSPRSLARAASSRTKHMQIAMP